MSAPVADNRERGITIEDHACQHYPVEPVDDDRSDWHDLHFLEALESTETQSPIVTEGTLAESKSCFDTYEDRNGRWWIRRGAHEQLLNADGVYILSVVDRNTTDVQRMAVVDATTVDALIDGEWWDCGDGGRTAEEFRQISWTSVFDTLDAPGGDRE